MGEAGFRHGMTPGHLKEIRRLGKENKLLKKLPAEKEIESHLKDELIKKKFPWPKGKNRQWFIRSGTYKGQGTQVGKGQ